MTRYRVAPMISNFNVQTALQHQFAQDPEYVKAVIWSYIQVKETRGRTTQEIAAKLSFLESELPHFRDIIQDVKRQFLNDPRMSRIQSYPQSPLSPIPRPYIEPIARHPSNASQHARRPSNVRQQSFETPPAEAAGPREPTPPPPPYLQADPDPESTRILESRLAAEEEASGRIAPERPSLPQRPPSDPEERRIWEESELLEAQRLSIAEERERKELEDAIRLSQLDLDTGAGPSTLAPPLVPDIARDTKPRFPVSPGLQSNNPFLSPRKFIEKKLPPRPEVFDPPPGPPPKPVLPQLMTPTRSRPSLPTRPRRIIDVQVDDTMPHDQAKEILLALTLENCSINLSFFASKREGRNLSSIDDLEDLFAGLRSRKGEPREGVIIVSDREDIGHALNSRSTPEDIRELI